MWISSCEARNFRNLASDEISYHPGLNWLFGPNGQGKTNALEMIYFALTSKSFRVSRASEMLCDPKAEGHVKAIINKGKEKLPFGVSVVNGSTTRYLRNKACKSPEFFRSAAVISFTARSKNLVEGAPEDRRRFIDRMVAYENPDHVLALARYRKGLTQLKQALLKSGNLGVYRGFKQTVLPAARRVADSRMQFLESVRDRANHFFRTIFEGDGDLQVVYKQRNVARPDDLEKRMMDVCAQEILHRRTMAGPHLDDLDIFIRDARARKRASSGQVRAVVLSLELAVRESYKNRLGYHPILLLDDIDAELDPQRLHNLLSYLSGRGQTLSTTSKYGTIEPFQDGSVFEVTAGRISPIRNA